MWTSHGLGIGYIQQQIKIIRNNLGGVECNTQKGGI